MSALISLSRIYLLIGLVLSGLVILTLSDRQHPKRLTTGLFWGLFALVFLLGDTLVALLGQQRAWQAVGVMVIVMALLAGSGQVKMGHYRQSAEREKQADAQRLKNRLFIPAMAVPVITLIATLSLNHGQLAGHPLLDPQQLTLAALTLACGLALLLGWFNTGGSPVQAISHSRRLVDSVGWAIILPQVLAMLGGVFVAADTGDSIKQLVSLFISTDSRLLMVIIYCVGMALFTLVLGNAFAAFPVLSAGIALPLLIQVEHAHPAPLLAMGM